MRFGNKFCESLPENQDRWSRYQAHLSALGLTREDPLYLLFGYEVFHDRPVRFQAFDPSATQCRIVVVNSYALNEAEKRRRRLGSGPVVNAVDFETSVRFDGVTRAERPGWEGLADPYYYQAEIDRIGSDWLLQVEMGDLRSFESEHIVLSIQFHTVEIEDITPKVAKYYGDDAKVAQAHLSSIDYDPERDR